MVTGAQSELAAFEFYVWFKLRFECDQCGEILECPLLEGDNKAPEGPWMKRNALHAWNLGWDVPALTSEGDLVPHCRCPACTGRRDS